MILFVYDILCTRQWDSDVLTVADVSRHVTRPPRFIDVFHAAIY